MGSRRRRQSVDRFGGDGYIPMAIVPRRDVPEVPGSSSSQRKESLQKAAAFATAQSTVGVSGAGLNVKNSIASQLQQQQHRLPNLGDTLSSSSAIQASSLNTSGRARQVDDIRNKMGSVKGGHDRISSSAGGQGFGGSLASSNGVRVSGGRLTNGSGSRKYVLPTSAPTGNGGGPLLNRKPSFEYCVNLEQLERDVLAHEHAMAKINPKKTSSFPNHAGAAAPPPDEQVLGHQTAEKVTISSSLRKKSQQSAREAAVESKKRLGRGVSFSQKDVPATVPDVPAAPAQEQAARGGNKRHLNRMDSQFVPSASPFVAAEINRAITGELRDAGFDLLEGRRENARHKAEKDAMIRYEAKIPLGGGVAGRGPLPRQPSIGDLKRESSEVAFWNRLKKDAVSLPKKDLLPKPAIEYMQYLNTRGQQDGLTMDEMIVGNTKKRRHPSQQNAPDLPQILWSLAKVHDTIEPEDVNLFPVAAAQTIEKAASASFKNRSQSDWLLDIPDFPVDFFKFWGQEHYDMAARKWGTSTLGYEGRAALIPMCWRYHGVPAAVLAIILSQRADFVTKVTVWAGPGGKDRQVRGKKLDTRKCRRRKTKATRARFIMTSSLYHTSWRVLNCSCHKI